MKTFLYTLAIPIAVALASCSSSRSLSSAMEDDIYYVPGRRALVAQEIENLSGQQQTAPVTAAGIRSEEVGSRATGSSIAPSAFSSEKQKVINPATGQIDNFSVAELTDQAKQRLAESDEIQETIYQNTGYWVNGYKGDGSDLEEIQRLINRYPDGFG